MEKPVTPKTIHTSRASTSKGEDDTRMLEKKPTVLEAHGYVLGSTVGSGSYATVKMAQSERHDCLVAIKIVSKFQAPSDYLKKFLPREIDVVKGLKHSNLIKFLQAIETTHRVYIVMEYAENGSLLEVIRNDHHIDETRARNWFCQLLEAVAYCHERGVVHRDIKCENLLLDHDRRIKLSDFGFARIMRSKTGATQLSETFCGSYAYASPEILKGVPYQPHMSDVWSMGVVLFAMVYGRLPYDDTNYNLLLKQVQAPVVFPRQPKVTTSCKTLIGNILAPLKSRIQVPGIRIDPWVNNVPGTPSSTPRPSTSKSATSNTVQKKSPTHTKEEAPVPLITKEILASESRKTDKNRKSTENEIIVENTLPKKETNL